MGRNDSSRHYPRPLLRPTTPSWSEAAAVERNGFIRWRRQGIFISSALAHDLIELAPDNRVYAVLYGPILLGILEPERLYRGLRRKRAPLELSLDQELQD